MQYPTPGGGLLVAHIVGSTTDLIFYTSNVPTTRTFNDPAGKPHTIQARQFEQIDVVSTWGTSF